MAYIVKVYQGEGAARQLKLCISGNVTRDFIEGFLAGMYFSKKKGKRHGCPSRRYAVMILE